MLAELLLLNEFDPKLLNCSVCNFLPCKLSKAATHKKKNTQKNFNYSMEGPKKAVGEPFCFCGPQQCSYCFTQAFFSSS